MLTDTSLTMARCCWLELFRACIACTNSRPYSPTAVGSSPGTSIPLPHRGSRYLQNATTSSAEQRRTLAARKRSQLPHPPVPSRRFPVGRWFLIFTYRFTLGAKKGPLQSSPFSFLSARDSMPITSPTMPHSVLLNVAPRASACGNDVGIPVEV